MNSVKTFCRTICLVALFQFFSSQILVLGGTAIQQPQFSYKLTLPEGWEQIPSKVMEEQRKAVAAVANGQLTEHYNDGYQQSAGGQWFQYPYILVQAKETGRIPEAQLAQMKSVRSGLQKGADQAAEKMSSFISDMSLGDTFYDSSNKCILIRLSMNVANVGEVKALTCGFLTQKGILLFHCYARAAEFDTQLPIFQEMLKTIELAEELRYKPHLGDGIGFDFGRIGRSTLTGAIIGGCVGLILMFIKKRQKNKSEPSSPPPLP